MKFTGTRSNCAVDSAFAIASGLAADGGLFVPDAIPSISQADIEKLYRTRILPAISKGLCGAIYTQLSDVEEEINGLLTYDRKVCKLEEVTMWGLAANLQGAMAKTPKK